MRVAIIQEEIDIVNHEFEAILHPDSSTMEVLVDKEK